jgi:hypothetical protein
MATKKKAKKKAAPQKRGLSNSVLVAELSLIREEIRGLREIVKALGEHVNAQREAIERLDFNIAGMHTLQTVAERVEAIEVALATPLKQDAAPTPPPTDAELLS